MVRQLGTHARCSIVPKINPSLRLVAGQKCQRFFDFLPERMEVKLTDEASSVTPQGGVSGFEWIEITRAKGGKSSIHKWLRSTYDGSSAFVG
jgi:hypothetical protein